MQTCKPPRILCGISIWCSSSILFTSVAKSTIKMKVYLTFNWPQDYIWLKQWEHRALGAGGDTSWSVLVRTQLWKIGCFSPHCLSPASGWVIPPRVAEIPFKNTFFLIAYSPFSSLLTAEMKETVDQTWVSTCISLMTSVMAESRIDCFALHMGPVI